jgi:HK97 family phage portal protein
MFKRLLGLDRKAAGALALSFGPEPAWSARGYAAFSREGYARNPVAHRCVRLIAEAAAACPLAVAGEGAGPEAARLLLAQPNPDAAGASFLETVYGQLQVAGDAYVELSGVQDGAPALYALRPDRVRVLPGPKGWPDGWEYRTAQGRRSFTRDRASGRSPILHLQLFNPADDLYGLSPFEAAAKAVDVHNAGAAWAKALLDNAARPSGALVVKGQDGAGGRLTEGQYERLRDELEAMHTGPGNAGRPLLLEGGLDWKPMGHSPAEMDFIGARREAAREIALAFGVPPMLLGLPGDNTYSNYKEANLAFYRQTILPLARKTAAAFEAWLKPWFGEAIAIALDEDTLPALSEERNARWRRIGEADFLNDAEKRRLLGVEGGAR